MQLRDFSRETASATDLCDAPADAVEDLRDALDGGFARGSSEPAEDLAFRLVPAVATARVKELPPMPSAEDLARTAERLRQFFPEKLEAETPEDPPFPESEPRGNVFSGLFVPQRVVSKVGRNDPCPCGSGKKHKKCCLK
jgi:hypothetical protein